MPENIDRESVSSPTLTLRKANRATRMLGLSRVIYIGAGLIKLRTLERKADRACRQLDPLPVLDRIPALHTLVKTYDMILDRRRILCGDPLPSRNGPAKASRQLLDIQASLPVQDAATGILGANQAGPETGVD